MNLTERYAIGEQLSSSKTVDIYTATDLNMGREVAFRRLFPQISRERCEECRPVFNQIFGHLSSLRAGGVLQVIDGGLDEVGYFLVTEKLEGTSLAARLREMPLNLTEFGQMVQDLLTAVSEIHAHKVYHTAISTRSLQLSPHPLKGVRFKIVDLGLAGLIRCLDPTGRARNFGMIDPCLMPPEYFLGELPTPQLDIYCCGHLLYCSLAGGHPWGSYDFAQMPHQQSKGDIVPITTFRKDVPKALSNWLQQMTCLDASNRFQTVNEALQACPEIPDDQPIKLIRTRKHRLVLGAAPHQPQLNVLVAPHRLDENAKSRYGRGEKILLALVLVIMIAASAMVILVMMQK